MSTDTPKKKPNRERTKLETKAFWIAFEMMFIFGFPAVLAVFGGRWLITEELLGDWVLYAALGLAFLTSWVIVIIRVRKFAAAFKQIDKGADSNS